MVSSFLLISYFRANGQHCDMKMSLTKFHIPFNRPGYVCQCMELIVTPLVKLLVLIYRCLHTLAPAYLSDLIIPYTPARSLRSADSNLITTNLYRLERCGRRRFSVAGPFPWNKLPASVKSANSLGVFKSALKTHLFREAFMTLL